MYHGHSRRHHTELCLPFQGLCIGLQSKQSPVAPLPASQLPPLAMQPTHQTQVIQDGVAFVHCMAIGIWLQHLSLCLFISSSTYDCKDLDHHQTVAGLQHSQAAAGLQVGVRPAVMQDYWAIAEVHSQSFYPSANRFFAPWLRLDRVLALKV